MKPILFLDADDVLAPGQPVCKHSAWELIEPYKQKAPEVDLLLTGVFSEDARFASQQICEAVPDLQVVVSSSWRHTYSRDEIIDIFSRGGLTELASRLRSGPRWCTAINSRSGSRSEDIRDWLARFHNGEPYAVLDDLASGASLADLHQIEPWRDRILLCEKGVGLQPKHAPFVVRALQRPVQRRQTQRMRRQA